MHGATTPGQFHTRLKDLLNGVPCEPITSAISPQSMVAIGVNVSTPSLPTPGTVFLPPLKVERCDRGANSFDHLRNKPPKDGESNGG